MACACACLCTREGVKAQQIGCHRNPTPESTTETRPAVASESADDYIPPTKRKLYQSQLSYFVFGVIHTIHHTNMMLCAYCTSSKAIAGGYPLFTLGSGPILMLLILLLLLIVLIARATLYIADRTLQATCLARCS